MAEDGPKPLRGLAILAAPPAAAEDAARPRYGEGDSSYRAAGGRPGITRLVDAFYRIMDELPEAAIIRRMHARDLTESRDKLTRFLCGWLNGPSLYAEKYGPIRIPSAHAHLRIGPRERDAWLRCMELAIDEQGYAPEFAAYLLRELRVPAERVRETSRDPLGSEGA
ncbi:MAG: group II truncated hemoglobin [Deltaproteobacteria bacterium]|nr:group II truncated hemoglobin [Deltaproteobacteria bacterium]